MAERSRESMSETPKVCPSGQYTLLLLSFTPPLRSIAATLHVVDPSAGLAAVVQVKFSQSSKSAPAAVRYVGPVRGGEASPGGPRMVRPLRPSGLARSRARLSAARIGGGVVLLEFVSPLIPIIRFASESFSRCRPVGTLRRFVAALPAGPRP